MGDKNLLFLVGRIVLMVLYVKVKKSTTYVALRHFKSKA